MTNVCNLCKHQAVKLNLGLKNFRGGGRKAKLITGSMYNNNTRTKVLTNKYVLYSTKFANCLRHKFSTYVAKHLVNPRDYSHLRI